MKKRKISKGKIAVTGIGAAAVGAGAYYLLGPDGEKHRKKTTALMSKMKKQVEKNAAKAKNLTEPLYHAVVDKVESEYNKQYKAHEKDIKAFAKKLKSEWKSIEKLAKKTAGKTVKRTVKKLKNKIK